MGILMAIKNRMLLNTNSYANSYFGPNRNSPSLIVYDMALVLPSIYGIFTLVSSMIIHFWLVGDIPTPSVE